MTSALVPTHDLLLALAGRVDDDLLGWARELVAGGEQGRAIELVTATLIADRTVLPAAIRAALVTAGRDARTILDADTAVTPAHDETDTPHLFDPVPPAAAGGAVDTITAVADEQRGHRLDGFRTYLTWRYTPAGAATGPLPHPVVLVELDGEAGAEELAHQFRAALEREGVVASVEVFARVAALPAYHEAARRAARLLATTAAATPEHPPAAPAEPAASAAAAHRLVLEPGRWPEPAAGESSAALAPPVPAAVSAWWAAADSLTEQAAVEPIPEPAPARGAADERVATGAIMPPAGRPGPALSDRPGPFDRISDDPLSGPLREPLLAPLLDPTIDEDDPLGVDDLFASRTAGTGGFDPAPRNGASAPLRDTAPEAPDDEPATSAHGLARTDVSVIDTRSAPEPAPVADPTPTRSIVGGRRSWQSPREFTADQPMPGPATPPAPPTATGPYTGPRDPQAVSTSGGYPVADSGPATAALPYPIPRDLEPSRDPTGDRAPSVIPAPTPTRDLPLRRRPAPGPPPPRPPQPLTDRPDRLGPMSPRPTPNPAPRDLTPPPMPAQPLPRLSRTNGPEPDPEPVTPVQGGSVVDPRLGLRPDSLERLSPTDRALLARLQNELGGMRTPQPNPRRPGPWRRPNPAPRPQPVSAELPDAAD